MNKIFLILMMLGLFISHLVAFVTESQNGSVFDDDNNNKTKINYITEIKVE